jgi:DNA-binding response OmpR family regulator
MAGKLFLINWNAKEAEQAAGAIRATGWEISGIETQDGGQAYKAIKADPPDAIVIYLTRKPSHGWETAKALRETAVTRHLPILFVGGMGKLTAEMKLKMPDAIFTYPESLAIKLSQFQTVGSKQ